MVKVDRRIRWHYTTSILRLRTGARLTRYRNCKFHNGCRTISRHADGISRYSVPPSAGPLLPLAYRRVYDSRHLQVDCQEPGSAPEPYARQSSMGYLFYLITSAISEKRDIGAECCSLLPAFQFLLNVFTDRLTDRPAVVQWWWKTASYCGSILCCLG